MNSYSRYSVVRLALTGLSLVCMMIMLVPSAYAQYPHKTASSAIFKHQHGATEAEKYNSPVTTGHQDKSQISDVSILVNQSHYVEIAESTNKHHANELVDESNHDDCCDICENLLTELTSAINNKTEDKRVLPVRHVKSVFSFHTTTTIHSGFISPFAPSPLQGTLRYRALLI